jgi:hypothetical protein
MLLLDSRRVSRRSNALRTRLVVESPTFESDSESLTSSPSPQVASPSPSPSPARKRDSSPRLRVLQASVRDLHQILIEQSHYRTD